MLGIVERVVKIIFETWDNAELFAFAHSKAAADVGAVGEDGVDETLLGGGLGLPPFGVGYDTYRHNAYMYAGD